MDEMPQNESHQTSPAGAITKPAPNPPRPLFIYGTLRAKPLLAWALTGDSSRVPDVDHMLRPALVTGYTRLAVKNGDYPAVVRRSASAEEQGCVVDGYLLQVDTTSQRSKLDDFEGETYALDVTTVQLVDQGNGQPTGETVEADIYRWAGDESMLEKESWDLDKFIRERLDDWLDLFDGMEMVGEEDDN